MICIDPYPGKLTYGRFYEILRKHARGYTIKMDDGSIDRMDKSRFIDESLWFKMLKSRNRQIGASQFLTQVVINYQSFDNTENKP